MFKLSKITISKIILVLLYNTISFSAIAEIKGNAKRGEKLSQQCIACHGADGLGIIDQYPKIAGQSKKYIIKQLNDFRNKTREEPTMYGFTSDLSEQNIADLAEYYSNKKSPYSKKTVSDKEKQIAEKIYYFGKQAPYETSACAACHGPSGQGIKSAMFPKISNQNTTYIKNQLIKFRQSSINEFMGTDDITRENDPNKMMQQAVKNLSNKEIEALAKYISSLH